MDRLSVLEDISSAAISDALDSIGIEGALLGIKPLIDGVKLIGPAFTVQYALYENKPTEFKRAGNYIDDVPEGAVVVIDNEGRSDCTTWGDILTSVAIRKKIKGTVLNGAARDIKTIRNSQYPLYASHVYMRSGKNRVYKSDQNCRLNIHGVTVNPGDIIFADDNGTLVIPKEYLDEVIRRAQIVEETEKLILSSISKGMSLKDAREEHGYHQPWINDGSK